ncbi:pyroglutamyl-peptidase I [Microbacterium sp. C7(2022)]|uniref:pyroglutamyl-peptidase I n=1 Tax=Microbacterium sp. C7(2022) TaxID=2992759 RepID=UPI00237A09EB|nr:pyroglutamyl-peptidase I [Microbacterium sp. C7(2022)]MDE0547196.1 pyroglutamyl-peptidase I [Microbacterium sp. C7(2022)]
MARILLTGFEPFGGDTVNPSGDAVALVADAWTGPDELVTATLPVSFRGAAEQMNALLDRHSPDIVIATGLAGGRSAVTPERVAINLADARIPDNDGAQPVDQESVPGGPPAAFATLPVKAIAGAIRDAGIPAEVSYSAGTYVCNHVFAHVMQWADAAPGRRGGFIHVPYATGQGSQNAPELPLEDIARALRIAVRISVDRSVDIHVTGGAIS